MKEFDEPKALAEQIENDDEVVLADLTNISTSPSRELEQPTMKRKRTRSNQKIKIKNMDTGNKQNELIYLN